MTVVVISFVIVVKIMLCAAKETTAYFWEQFGRVEGMSRH